MSYKSTNPFKVRLSALAVASCLGGVPVLADAAGLGRITVLSALGQPLRAEIEVSASKDELPNMVARLAAPEAFKAAGMDYPTILTSVRMALDKRPDGQPIVRLSSDRPVSDPYIDLLVELNWSAGRLVREYTFLIDPPEANKDVATNPPVAKPVEAAPKVEAKPVEKAPEPVVEKPVEKPAETTAETPAEKKSAPAAAEKAAAPEAASTPKIAEPSGVRAVKDGDYLTRIAREVKPEGVTLDQMLVGLFRANPEAFQGKNMNRLKTGKILTIPAAEQVAATAPAEARKQVIAHASDWNAYRRKLAGVAAQEQAAAPEVQQETAGKISAKVQDKSPAATESKDKVKVSKTETSGAVPAAGKKAEEDKVAREKALKESAERAAQLEKNVADLQKLNELKSKSLAEAQKNAAAAAPAVAAKPAETAKPVEAAKPAEVVMAPEAAMPTKPKAKAPPPPPPEEEEDLLANPAIWGGLVALLGGVGGLLFYRRRKAAQESGESDSVVSSLAEPSLGANSVFRATGGQSVDTSNATPAVTDFSQTGPGTIDTDEVDPVAEAEVYMAYGRDAQAEEILLEALQKDSKRLAIHLKLLEIYAQRKSAKQFETLATELFAQTGGSGPEWEKAAAMGAKLDPANPLYHGTVSTMAEPAAASAGAFDPDATMVVSSPMADLGKSTVVMPGAFAQMAEPATAGAVAAGEMSFDLDMGAPAFAATPARQPEPASETPDLGGLAMDISFELPGASSAQPAQPTPAPVADGGGLDFDLGFGAATNFAAPVDETVDLGAASSVGLDFDVKLTDSAFAPEPLNKPNMSSINLDLAEPAGEMDFERTLFVTPGLAAEMGTASAVDANVETDLGFGAEESQEVATKLDLAKAYEEMGDAEGARELLQEVLVEGSAGQKEAAKAILARLG